MSKYLMSKTDFTVSGFSELVMKQNTHVEINFDMMKYVDADRKTNGPKLLLFLMRAVGVKDEVRDSAFFDMLRAEQKKVDEGGDKYVPPTPVVPAAPQELEVAPTDPAPAPATPEASDALSELRQTLEALSSKADILAYAEKTLNVKLDADGRIGRERLIETVLAKFQQNAQA